MQKLEAAFEFGAAIAIDFGVASGGVHVMAGIYFKMEPGKASLTGYFRLGGYVDVLGLISASIELYMDLTYDLRGRQVHRARQSDHRSRMCCSSRQRDDLAASASSRAPAATRRLLPSWARAMAS